MRQGTKVVTDSKGRKRTIVRFSCACCASCWLYLDTGTCLCGGPFKGYIDADPSDPAPVAASNTEQEAIS